MTEPAPISGPDDAEWLDDPHRHPSARPGALSKSSSILAVIPHFRCNDWLGACLDSLLRQTHRLDGVVVIDDASDDPPVDVVQKFPEVTLLEATENVGPYRLTQQIVAATHYDAYLMQDADDWSLPMRLELLLREAERTGAEMIGCQGYRLISVEGEVVPLTFPLDVNAALNANPTRHVVMHPSTVVTRALVERAGGYAMGLRFGADTEFEHRAMHVGRIVNIPEFAYVVRNREASLTSSPDTGLQSAARTAQREAEAERALANAERVAMGEAPDLTPMATAEPVPLRHLLGPLLRAEGGRQWPE